MDKKHYRQDSLLGRWLYLNFEDYPESTCQLRGWLIGSVLMAPFTLLPVIGRALIPDRWRLPADERMAQPSLIVYGWLGLGITVICTLISFVWWETHKSGFFLVFAGALALSWIVTCTAMAVERAQYFRDQRRQEHPPSGPDPQAGPSSWDMIVGAFQDLKNKVCKPIVWKA